MAEVHLFMIWEKAQNKEEEILKDIKNSFQIIKTYKIKWSEKYFSENLSRFYGTNLPDGSHKEEHCGKGPFTLITILDENPKYEERDTSSGKQIVNINIFDKKEYYRSLTGGGHRIHATNTEIETNHDLTLLLKINVKDYLEKNKNNFNEDKEEYIETDLLGAEEWESVEQLFYALNNCIKYTILRNYECLPEELYMKDHNDIDIMCEEHINCAYILNAKKVFDEPNRVHYTTNIGELKLFFDLRYIGDRYYCKNLEKNLLENRTYSEKGFFVVDKEYYFYSLLYHALIHKMEFGKDYIERLINMNYELTHENCSTEKALDILKEWIVNNQYMLIRPIDQSVVFNKENVLKITESIYGRNEDNKINELLIENNNLKEELRSMANSKSWRITKPIRDITTYIKKARENKK